MSSKPTPKKAERVLEILEQVTELTERIDVLTPQVHRLTRELKLKCGDRQKLQQEMGELMREMDCDSPGNFGWPGRVSWLVAEVVARMKKREAGEQEATP